MVLLTIFNIFTYIHVFFQIHVYHVKRVTVEDLIEFCLKVSTCSFQARRPLDSLAPTIFIVFCSC